MNCQRPFFLEDFSLCTIAKVRSPNKLLKSLVLVGTTGLNFFFVLHTFCSLLSLTVPNYGEKKSKMSLDSFTSSPVSIFVDVSVGLVADRCGLLLPGWGA